jgi:hypothetical protein
VFRADAILGGVVGVGAYGVSVISGEKSFSWVGLGAAAAGGVVGGLIGGGCIGLTDAIAIAVCGAAAGAAGDATIQAGA